MGFLKNLFSNKHKYIDNKAIDNLLNSIDFYNEGIPADFYSQLIDLYTPNIDKKNDLTKDIAFQEFKQKTEELSVLYNKIIGSRFEKQQLNNFIEKFKALTTEKTDYPGVITMMCSYWYQPILKTQKDVNNSNNEQLIESFEEFRLAIKNHINEIISIKKRSIK